MQSTIYNTTKTRIAGLFFTSAVVAAVSMLLYPGITCAQGTIKQEAQSTQTVAFAEASLEISPKQLEKFATSVIDVDDNGARVQYKGVALRNIVKEMAPSVSIDLMPEWKKLSRLELIVEVKGDDGFPALITATEVAINKSGDKFVLATERDGKTFENSPQLICKDDSARVRWIRKVVSVRITSVMPKSAANSSN